MPNVNRAVIMGILGKDPEVKNFGNGSSIATFSVATSEHWKDKNTGERKEQTEWHRIVLNNRLGEIAQQYLRKGSKVYIEGSLRTRQWTDQNGQERYTTEVRGDQMQMLDSARQQGGGEQGFAEQNTGYNQPRFNNQNQNTQNNQQGGGYNNQAQQGGGYNNQPAQGGYGNAAPQAAKPQPAAQAPSDLDDDLPF